MAIVVAAAVTQLGTTVFQSVLSFFRANTLVTIDGQYGGWRKRVVVCSRR